MPKKPTDKAIMDALTKKVTAITKGQAKPSKASPIDTALRQAITASGLSYYALGRAAGVDPSVILRFMAAGEDRGGDMRLSTAAKVAAVLGLSLR